MKKRGGDRGKTEGHQRESDMRRESGENVSACVLCKPQVVLVVLDRSITRGTTAPAWQVSPHLSLSLSLPYSLFQQNTSKQKKRHM